MSLIQTIFAAPKILIMNSKDQSGKRPRIRKTDERSKDRPEKSRFSKPYHKEEEDGRKPERKPYKSAGNKDQRPSNSRNTDERTGSDRSYSKPQFNKDRRRTDSKQGGYRERPSRGGSMNLNIPNALIAVERIIMVKDHFRVNLPHQKALKEKIMD